MSGKRSTERRQADAVAGRGPDQDLVEYLVLRTPDLASIEELAPGLRRLVETSQIAVLDLVGVQTDALGTFRVVDAEGLPQEYLLDRDVGGILSEDDIALVCVALGPNASAWILVAEDLWARPLMDAVYDGGVRVVGGERIPRRLMERARRDQDRPRPDGATTGTRAATSRRQRVDLLRRRPILDEGPAIQPPA
jgi:hypothetical protein